MEKNYFDVIIIGGGVIGCSIARYLSRFKVNALLIEKHFDVAEETSSANSAIVHSGYDPLPNTKKAYFNVDHVCPAGSIRTDTEVRSP